MKKTFIDLNNEDLKKNINMYSCDQIEYSIKHNHICLLELARTQKLNYSLYRNYYVISNNNTCRILTLPEFIYLQPHMNIQKCKIIEDEMYEKIKDYTNNALK